MPDAEVYLRIVHRSLPRLPSGAQLDANVGRGPGLAVTTLDENVPPRVGEGTSGPKRFYLGVRLGQRGMSRPAGRRDAGRSSSGAYAGGEPGDGLERMRRWRRGDHR